jgi:hypothetical protein
MYRVPSEPRDGHTPDQLRRFSGRRRIRGGMYIWGSQGVTADMHFQTPLVLHIRNDVFGEQITVSTEKADGTRTVIGALEAGENLSISIQDIRGIYASCRLESTVSCVISGDPSEFYFGSSECDDTRPSPWLDAF